MKKIPLKILSSILSIILIATFFFNTKINKKNSINNFIQELDPREYRSLVLQKFNLKEINSYKVFRFTPPMNAKPFLDLKVTKFNFFGEQINIVTQNGDIVSADQASYFGYIFPEDSNSYKGYISLGYFKGFINGTIEFLDNYAKIEPLEKDIFVIAKLTKKPKFSCGNYEEIKMADNNTEFNSNFGQPSNPIQNNQQIGSDYFDNGVNSNIKPNNNLNLNNLKNKNPIKTNQRLK